MNEQRFIRCPKCGYTNPANFKGCSRCGLMFGNYTTNNRNRAIIEQPVVIHKETCGMAISSFICGIFAFLLTAVFIYLLRDIDKFVLTFNKYQAGYITGFLATSVLSILSLFFGIAGIRTCNRKKKGGIGLAIAGLVLGCIGLIFVIIAVSIIAFELYEIRCTYSSAGKEYEELDNQYVSTVVSTVSGDDMDEDEKRPFIARTTELEDPATKDEIIKGTQTQEVQENGLMQELPILYNPIDFEGLEEVNEEVIAWIKISALDLSYPVTQAQDNEYYLHKTFRKEDSFAGSIFLNCNNTKFLTDQNSILYGHNMKDGSMFGTLNKYQQQNTYDNGQYFWVFTKEFIYQYHIFSASTVDAIGDPYKIEFTENEFDEFIKNSQAHSYIKTDVEIPERARIMTLSTNTGDSSTRFIVQGLLEQVYVATRDTGDTEE